MTLAAATAARADPLIVTIAGVRNDVGQVRLAVCSKATFLKPTCEHVGSAPAKVGDVVIRLEDVPPGTCAPQPFLHENENGKIDTNLIGIPTEGLGFSNDAQFHFGPPGFSDAAFLLGRGGGRIRFSLRYF